MHVEIDDGHALGAMRRHGVTRRDGGVVEKAKAHRRAGQSVMAGRPRRDEGVFGRAAHDRVDGEDGAAGGARGGLEGARAHGGVVDAGRQARRDPRDIGRVVRAEQRFARGARRLGAEQRAKGLARQRGVDGRDPLRAIPAAGAGVVNERRWRRDEKRPGLARRRRQWRRRAKSQRFAA